MSVVSRRPGCIQHGRLSSTSTQVVANQTCSCETDTDPIQQMRLLSLWSQYMEQSSSSSQQHWQSSSVKTSYEVTFILLCFYCVTFTRVYCDYCNAQSALYCMTAQYKTFLTLTLTISSHLMSSVSCVSTSAVMRTWSGGKIILLQ